MMKLRRPRLTTRAPSGRRSWRARLVRWTLLALSLPLIVSVLQVLMLRWIDPPTSGVMLERRSEWLSEEKPGQIAYQWRPWSELPATLAIAVIAAEDQQFAEHSGFDTEAIRAAWAQNREGEKSLRGGSTISQQVAKNLFLWSDRSWLRKGLEAWYTVLIEALWSKQRILEVYLNIAEFGDGVYGAQAASERYFNMPAGQLTAQQAASLAAVLPSPRRYSVAAPSAYVQRRRAWIERQVLQLGGKEYLMSLDDDQPRTK